MFGRGAKICDSPDISIDDLKLKKNFMFLDFSIETRLILSVLVSLLLSTLLRFPIFKVAKKKEFYEKANGRSSHTGVVPNVGGTVIFTSFVAASFLFVKFQAPDIPYIFLAASMVFGLGLYDDLLVISFRKKFIGEIIGATFLILGGLYFTNFHGLFGTYELSPWFGIPFTLFMVVGIVNAMNLIDGIDGLCSGLSALIISSFSIWFLNNGFTDYAIMGFSISAAIIPFFIQNVFCKKNKMFLGDNGSLFLGMILSFIAIKFSELSIGVNQWKDFEHAPAIAFCFLAIPVIDTVRVFALRMLNGKSPFYPDKKHIHHRILFLYDGNHKKATFTILAIQFIFIVIGLTINTISNEFLITLAIVTFLLIYFIILRLFLRKQRKSNLN